MSYSYRLGYLFLGGPAHALGPDCVRLAGCRETKMFSSAIHLKRLQVDDAISALIDDLHSRGLADDVAVVMWGEFGRTPKINSGAGRDHWLEVMSVLVAGGGLRHRVISARRSSPSPIR
ncbi:MAG TPA: DUF1501 domain-containing protein [Planctomycetota bacterium]|nr:DUF1501 domain-containing protein [Planctomycetota bacterium]